MRNLISKLAFFGIALMVSMVVLQSFTAPPDKYKYGNRSAVTLTSADTVAVSPNNLTLTYATVAMDADIVFNVDVSNSPPGDRIILDLTADGTDRTATFGTNITGLAETISANKNELLEFIYNGTVFKEVAEMAVD
ncbi:hypothetical protein C8N47_11186 [Mangrovibacterium marinum]|uniref:Uncharacterized protein n=1 Tax=Mangrovibacterium marinum TaxID=1639118 RepID=A0A2T5C0D2_9BACT|nr:hypothetical protein [Mangrovibacterium marinum]PTN08046.1 hypothetical protein C8N47_11186 [Mangrovibacterium marinum]